MKKSKYLWSMAIILMVLSVSVPAKAQIPDPVLSSATTAGGVIFICPAGDGQLVPTITVTLLDAGGNPVVDYPKENIRVESIVSGELVFCNDGNIADNNTNMSGVTTFTGTLVGGGYTQGGLQIVVGGVALVGSPLAIDVNSPDINGDLRVDLCDLVPFTTDFYGGYAFRSDFDHNFVLNLADVATMAQHLCGECPEGTPAPTVTLSGEIGLFFDTAATQSGILGITQGSMFDYYVVAISAPDDIQAYQFGITVDPTYVLPIVKTVYPLGSVDLAGAGDPYNAIVVPSTCLQVTGPTVLAHIQAILVQQVTDLPICLGPPSQYFCGFGPPAPGYLSCLTDCDWRQFYTAYEGCAILNGEGPIPTEMTTWGQVKALYNDR